MSDLVAIEFLSEAKAEQVRHKLPDLQPEYLIELDDAVVAVKRLNGRIKLNQLFHPGVAGAGHGALWGVIIGLLFIVPLGRAIIGAASGALGGALTEVGTDDRFMKGVGRDD